MDSQSKLRRNVEKFLQKLSSVGFPLNVIQNFSSTWTVNPFAILLGVIRCWLKGPTASFRHAKHRNWTELRKHIWSLKGGNIDYLILFHGVPFHQAHPTTAQQPT